MSYTCVPHPTTELAITTCLRSEFLSQQVAVGGENRAKQNWRECLVLSFLAGAYIGKSDCLIVLPVTGMSLHMKVY